MDKYFFLYLYLTGIQDIFNMYFILLIIVNINKNLNTINLLTIVNY